MSFCFVKIKRKECQAFLLQSVKPKTRASFLTQKQKRQFEENKDLYCECWGILQETAFTYEMKLGIKILLDALTNN